MAAFSYQQQHAFLLDDALHLPGFDGVGGEEEEVNNFEYTGSVNFTTVCSKFDLFEQPSERASAGNSDNETSVNRRQSTDSSTVLNGDQPSQGPIAAANKRRKAKDAREARSKKQKNGNEEKAKKESKAEKKKDKPEPPTGYIHVRARRGQATDSHSLAERVRREKISLRMRTLQKLVPGCDKVTGKALMLDEIINYVQSLQTQVEFLSMKLASLNPVCYDFGADLDGFMVRPEGLVGMESNLPPAQQYGSTAFSTDATTTTNFASSSPVPSPHPFLDNSSSLLLPQGNGNLLRRDVEDQRHEFLSVHSSDFSSRSNNNLCSFH